MLITLKSDIRSPTAPVLGTPTALSSSSISVPMTSVATDVGGVASYALERALSAAGTYSVISSAATFPYTDSSLSASTTYYYRARATDTSGNVGNYSAIVSQATMAVSSGTILFRADFSSESQSGFPANCYNFATRSGGSLGGNEGVPGVNGTYTHLPTGGPGGIPAVRLTQNAGRYQYPLTYTTPAFGFSWDANVEGRNRIYYRWLIRVDPGSVWDSDTCGGKFIDHGVGDNRNIVWLTRANAYFDSCDEYGRSTWGLAPTTFPSYFGLTGANEFGWQQAPNTNKYGYQFVSRGVSNKECWPGVITASDYTPIACGPNSGPTSAGGWIYGQAMAKGGNNPFAYVAPPAIPGANPTPHCEYRIWMQNNNFNSPTGIQQNWFTETEPAGLDPSAWNAQCAFGTYCGGGSGTFSSVPFAFTIAKFEIGTAFDPNWFPG